MAGLMAESRDRDEPATDPLLTDLYQLTMLQAYWRSAMSGVAVFEFFVRKLPKQRLFLMAAGLEQVLQYLETLQFNARDMAWLRSTRRFDPQFLDWLASLRFTGDVHAMPEGTLFFPDEPILRVTAPLPVAQFVESRIVNLLHFQTLVASKAARMVLQQPKAMLIDFGLRRAHGAEAGLLAARASYIAGFTGTATLAAERAFGIPAFGTMAHSFIQAHDGEMAAFRSFATAWPRGTTLLIDTYNTIEGARRATAIARELAGLGITIGGVRLDSGDLIALSQQVRQVLDAEGFQAMKIFASSSVDEYLMAQAASAKAPIDGYGVGTHLTTSSDAPNLDCAYKLQEYAGKPRRKHSAGKATWPGRKQVYRSLTPAGRIEADIVTVEGDRQTGASLLIPVMRDGQRLADPEPMAQTRDRAAASLATLPDALRKLDRGIDEPAFRPAIAAALLRLADEADRAIRNAAQGEPVAKA
jgi:nicotinate phosphoribosyltransferase